MQINHRNKRFYIYLRINDIISINTTHDLQEHFE
jgi:hypothetical protein